MKLPLLLLSRKGSLIAGLALILVAFGGGSAYAAHSNALPGSVLYPLKHVWEEGKLLLSFSPASKAEAQISIAQDRIKSAQEVVSATPAATNGSNAITALQQAQEQLKKALDNANKVNDPTKRKEIKDSISKEAANAETEAEDESVTEVHGRDKQDLQNTTDQIKQVKNQASTND